ncbi:MAG: protein phosphatase 2C domain-containing protein [Flavobacteriales bacterium]|nr:protein phosphatase 2C domain-containing protein [Flavobacteriales bacterium]
MDDAPPSPLSQEPADAPARTQDWVIVGDSVPGHSHILNGLPCQDCFTVISIDRSWLLMITSDGAGSSPNSQRGSALLCTTIAPGLIAELVKTRVLDLSKGLPSVEEWARIGNAAFARMREELRGRAVEQGLESSEFNATLSVALFSTSGLLVGHLGDGRGAYLNAANEWVAAMRPHKGEEPNQTVFVSSKWDALEKSANGVPIPEFAVYEGPIRAVALLTDGMEKHAFECSVMDMATTKWTDPNTPFQRFFTPLRSSVLTKSALQDELNAAWSRFLKEGTPAMKLEHDDKTLVLACLLEEQQT